MTDSSFSTRDATYRGNVVDRLKSLRATHVEGECYRHYKGGGFYRLVCFSIRIGDSEILITYESVSSPGLLFTRPVAEFFEDVAAASAAASDGRAIHRFTLMPSNNNCCE